MDKTGGKKLRVAIIKWTIALKDGDGMTLWWLVFCQLDKKLESCEWREIQSRKRLHKIGL